jgi:hypothetical protein
LNRIAKGGDLGPRDYPRTRFSNWIRRESTDRLEPNEVSNVLIYLTSKFRELEHGRDSDTHGDPDLLVAVVSRLNEYLCVSPRTIDGMQRRFEGYYWVFRPSITAPGRYIRGLLGMRWVVGDTQPEGYTPKGMIRACEVHRHPGDEGYPMPALSESYDGFALVKKGVLFLFMSERFADHDRGPLLVVRMHSFLPADPKQPLQMAWGRAAGASGSAYALPIVIMRVTDDEMKNPPGETTSLADLERLWVVGKDARLRKTPPAYLSKLLDQCQIVDTDAVPPTVLAQIDAMNRESWLFSEQFRCATDR